MNRAILVCILVGIFLDPSVFAQNSVRAKQGTAAETAAQSCEGALDPASVPKPKARKYTRIVNGKAGWEFGGLTEEGLKFLKEQRDILRARDRLFEQEFKSMTSLHHVAEMARLGKWHIFLWGPPGAAKTLFVDWLFSGELSIKRAFKLMLHQMINEQAFTGGQRMDAAREGRFEINTEGSAVEYAVWLLDEIDKGNPVAYAALLGLLNERRVLLGNKVVQAKLETLISTSNANLAEFYSQLKENGMGSTAPALLNRYHFKAFIYNWLGIEDHLALSERVERKRRLHALLADGHEEVLQDEVFVTPDPIDWDGLRPIAENLCKASPDLKVLIAHFTDEFRLRTHHEIQASEVEHARNPKEHPFVYAPSAEESQRLRLLSQAVIENSAFLDFLRSPLADDGNLEALVSAGGIELDAISIWRAWSLLTTVGPGETRLVYVPNAEKKFQIEFGWKDVSVDGLRDARERKLVEDLRGEQARFVDVMDQFVAEIARAVELSSRHPVPGSDASMQNLTAWAAQTRSFEVRLASSLGRIQKPKAAEAK